MIVRKEWYTEMAGLRWYEYEGWFLFGFIPLYIRRHGSHKK